MHFCHCCVLMMEEVAVLLGRAIFCEILWSRLSQMSFTNKGRRFVVFSLGDAKSLRDRRMLRSQEDCYVSKSTGARMHAKMLDQVLGQVCAVLFALPLI